MAAVYSIQDIAINNGQLGKPTWIIIKDVVYDVTQFLDEHPGGDATILEYAGRDATKAFNDVGHSMDAIQDLKKYKIGQVAKQPIEGGASRSEPQFTETPKKKKIKLFFCC